MVDVYDGAYAEAHVGLLNFHVDIVKAFICFKGHIGYNLNVLKVSVHYTVGSTILFDFSFYRQFFRF